LDVCGDSFANVVSVSLNFVVGLQQFVYLLQ